MEEIILDNSETKPGPRSAWDISLGKGYKKSIRLPFPVHSFIREKWVKSFLNELLINPQFKEDKKQEIENKLKEKA